jgi:2,3-bisphosphoglycerate-dependent phosphoglycerate mutase
MMKLSIVLFRHGEIASKKNIFCGWINLPLSAKGEKEAEILSGKLRDEKIEIAFCSDQLRSQQCLLQVLKFHPDAKIIIDPRLRERHYGALSGSLKDDTKKKSSKKFEEIHRGYYALVPDGENFHHVSKRVFPFMTDLLKFMQKEKVNVAISAHSNSLKLIQEYLEGLSAKKVEGLIHHPASYKKYIVEFE